MKKTRLTGLDVSLFPGAIGRLLEGQTVYDSSCSQAARVYYAESGLYVKEAALGSLGHEAAMSRLFHAHGLGPEVMGYVSEGKDYLVTRAVPGQDLTHYLDQPLLLCEKMAEALLQLHSISGENVVESPNLSLYQQGCQGKDAFERYVLMEKFPIASRQEAVALAAAFRPLLKRDVLIHGDACLPNLMMENGRITGFIDFSVSGAGDRHMDLFWAVWSLAFNLKTERYTDVFLDAYGKNRVNRELLLAVSAMEALGG